MHISTAFSRPSLLNDPCMCNAQRVICEKVQKSPVEPLVTVCLSLALIPAACRSAKPHLRSLS